jgi:hypothetical protein
VMSVAMDAISPWIGLPVTSKIIDAIFYPPT